MFSSKSLALLLVAAAGVNTASAQDVTCCQTCFPDGGEFEGMSVCYEFGRGPVLDGTTANVVAPFQDCIDLGYFQYRTDDGRCGMTGNAPNGDCYLDNNCLGVVLGFRQSAASCFGLGGQSLTDFYMSPDGTCNSMEDLMNNFPTQHIPPPPAVIGDGPDGTGGINMDPHVQKWNGEWYDYNGECDLVLLSVPELDLDIHVRTTIRYAYSFIQTAAIRVGKDVLEVASWGEYLLNGVDGALEHNNHGEAVPMLGGYPIHYVQMEAIKHRFIIPLDDHGHNVTVLTYKDFVNVQIDAPGSVLANSHGLMGDFHTGLSLARDGKTVLTDPVAFGQEWQVREDEPSLFDTVRAPQAPLDECRLPKEKAQKHDENSVLHQAAVKECEEHARQNKAACVADVMATGDLGMVQGSGAF